MESDIASIMLGHAQDEICCFLSPDKFRTVDIFVVSQFRKFVCGLWMDPWYVMNCLNLQLAKVSLRVGQVKHDWHDPSGTFRNGVVDQLPKLKSLFCLSWMDPHGSEAGLTYL
jgi:hypothetical protein